MRRKVIKVIPVQREGIISSPDHGEQMRSNELQQREEGFRIEARGPIPACLEKSSGI